MHRRKLLLAAPLAGAWLSACSLDSRPRRDFFLLRDAGARTPAAPGPRIDKVLLVSAMAMPGLYDSDRMVFSADGRSRSYFQFGYWSERPAQSLETLAAARLLQSARFRDVALSTAGIRGDLLLSLRLDELYLDAAQTPDTVMLSVSAELIDWRERRLIARRAFSQPAEVPERGASGLADAASIALARTLDDLVPWAVASAAG